MISFLFNLEEHGAVQSVSEISVSNGFILDQKLIFKEIIKVQTVVFK